MEIIDAIPGDQREAIRRILFKMFPSLQTEFQESGVKSYSNILPDPCRLKICQNYDTFLKFFRYQLDSDLFSNTELVNILHNISDPDKFAEYILQLSSIKGNETSKAFTFFESIYPLINKDIPIESLEKFIQGCFLIDEKIYTNSEVSHSKSLFTEELSLQIGRTIDKTLFLMDYNNRLNLLLSSFSSSNSLVLMSDFIIIIRQQNGDKNWEGEGKRPDSEILLQIDDLKQIEEIFLERIHNIISNNIMRLAGPEISSIIYVWDKLSPSNSDLDSIITRFFSDDNLIMEIILLSREQNCYRPIMPYSLEPYISEEVFRNKVQDLLTQKGEILDESQKDILKGFIREKMVKWT